MGRVTNVNGIPVDNATYLKSLKMYPARPIVPQHPMASVVASAARITSADAVIGNRYAPSAAGSAWQEDAWNMYDLVGEQRFLAQTLAGRMSQARLYVGKLPDNDVDIPIPTKDEQLLSILESVGGQSGRSQIVQRLGVNLFVAGDGWLVGIPSRILASPEITPDPLNTPEDGWTEDMVADLSWRMLSSSEVDFKTTGKVVLKLGPSPQKHYKEVQPSDVFLVKVWRGHPRWAWEPDSPTRSSLPILRELTGLTMHISAQVDSRLAGAGIFVVPDSASRAMKAQMGLPDDSPDDPFTDALVKSMMTPINNRDSASALVPLVITVPDDVTEKFHHISFSLPLDGEARALRDEAIRRLALGQDAPPELLLGTGGMNHWGAWLVREDVVNTHLEPPLALICDAMTTQFLRPLMKSLGYSAKDIAEHVIWYDVSHMILRPNRAMDAERLWDRGAISAESFRAASGFEESDAPFTVTMDPEYLTVFEMIKADPILISSPGIEFLVEQVKGVLNNAAVPLPEPPVALPGATGSSTEDAPVDNESYPGEDEDNHVPAYGKPPNTKDKPATLPGS